MARGPRYRVSFRRRREGKTDYKARKSLLLSEKPRLVARGSLKNMSAQMIIAKLGGDKVIVSSHSMELTANHGWKGPTGNVPAAYLTGYLCGSKARAQGLKDAILDLGLQSPTKNARVFAVLKGVLDAGIEVAHSEEKLPDERRIEGQHIVGYAEALASNPDEYQRRFSQYLRRKLPPENVSRHFAEVKKQIAASTQRANSEGGSEA